jgi:chromosome partitioning protein
MPVLPPDRASSSLRIASMSIIAVFNQKGGVGTTTTALNLLAAIARRGQRPLGIDLDPHAHLSHCFGARPKLADDSVYSFFGRQRPLADLAEITRSGVALCPAHPDLARLDAQLSKGINAITALRRALSDGASTADAVVIDTTSLLNALSLNAIFACDLCIVPVSCEFLAVQAAREVERALNALEPVLKARLARRYLLTRYDAEKEMSIHVAEQLTDFLPPEHVCTTRIREDEMLAQSPTLELDIFRHAPNSDGAQDYQSLVEELAAAGFIR